MKIQSHLGLAVPHLGLTRNRVYRSRTP